MRFIMIVLTAVLVSCIAENEPFLIEEVKITPVSASEGSRFEYCAKVLSLTASELVIVLNGTTSLEIERRNLSADGNAQTVSGTLPPVPSGYYSVIFALSADGKRGVKRTAYFEVKADGSGA